MATANPVQQTIIDPQLEDKVIAQINTELISRLSWLDAAYGKAYRLVERAPNGSNLFKPAVYVGGSLNREYFDMMPDEHKGNFVFWDVADDAAPQQWSTWNYNDSVVSFGLVFWGNIEKIYPTDHKLRTIQHIKQEFIDILQGINIVGGTFTITGYSERAENIYPGYTTTEIANQYLMRPYVGLRFSGTFKIRIDCADPPT